MRHLEQVPIIVVIYYCCTQEIKVKIAYTSPSHVTMKRVPQKMQERRSRPTTPLGTPILTRIAHGGDHALENLISVPTTYRLTSTVFFKSL